MELKEIKQMWTAHNTKMDQVLSLNKDALMRARLSKAQLKMRVQLIWRIIEAVIFLMIVVSLWQYIVAHLAWHAATISAGILNVFALIGLAGSVGQIALIGTIDYAGSVTTIQKQINRIDAHELAFFKLLIWSAPFYLAFILLGFEVLWGVDLFTQMSKSARAVNLIATVITAIPVVWLYRQLKFDNSKHPWVKKMVNRLFSTQSIRAWEFLNEIGQFEK